MKIAELNSWESNTKMYLNNLNAKLIEVAAAKNLYYGFDVIDGQLKMNPDILFIGINPGYGDQNRHFEVKFSSDRISYLDFFDNEYSYPLARDTVKVFQLMGLNDEEIVSLLQNRCVKTNLYHIITYSEKEIKQCINASGGSFGDYYHNSVSSCISLIATIKPKIVIFEGKSIYNEIVRDIYEVSDSWNSIDRIGYHFYEQQNVHFLGYQRMRSNILNKEVIAAKLKEIII